MSKGEGFNRNPKAWGSFVFPYFYHLLDIKWGEGGLTMFPMFWGTFCINIGKFRLKKVTSRLSKMGRYKSYLKMSKKKGGRVEATFGQCKKKRRFISDVFSYLTELIN